MEKINNRTTKQRNNNTNVDRLISCSVNRSQSGVSFIELLLVIAIIAILGASVTPFLSNFILRNNLETTTDKVIGSIRKAQNYSMDGKNDAVWGVCTTGSHLRLFRGSCESLDFSEDFTVSGSVNVSGLEDPGITFSKLRGEPSSSLSVTISTNIDSNSVQVNTGGGMEIN